MPPHSNHLASGPPTPFRREIAARPRLWRRHGVVEGQVRGGLHGQGQRLLRSKMSPHQATWNLTFGGGGARDKSTMLFVLDTWMAIRLGWWGMGGGSELGKWDAALSFQEIERWPPRPGIHSLLHRPGLLVQRLHPSPPNKKSRN